MKIVQLTSLFLIRLRFHTAVLLKVELPKFDSIEIEYNVVSAIICRYVLLYKAANDYNIVYNIMMSYLYSFHGY